MRYINGLTKRKALTAFLLIAILAGVALRFTELGGQSLWTDEMLTVDSALIDQPISASHVFGVLQGPLVSVLVKFWGSISMNEGFLRFPFALAGGLTVLFVYLFSRYLSGAWVSLSTAFVASLSPVLIWYSQEVRGYAFVVLFTVLMTYYLVRWVGSRKHGHLFAYGLLLFAALLSNLSAAFVAGSHLIYMLASPARRRLLGLWILTVLVVLLFFSPWVRTILIKTDVDRLVTTETGEPLRGGARWSALTLPYVFFTYSVGYTLGPSLRLIQLRGLRAVAENLHWVIAAAVIFAAALAVGVREFKRENSDLLFLLLVWIIVPVIAVSVLSLRNVKVFTPRYALVALPPYAMIVGRGLAAIARSRWWPVTAAFAGLMAVSLFNYFLVPAYGRDDARGVAGTIREHYEEGDGVVAVYAARPLAYYLEDFAEVSKFEADDVESRLAMEAKCGRIAAEAERVWLSLCREWILDPDGVIRGWFDQNMVLVRSFEFSGMRLYLYTKRSA